MLDWANRALDGLLSADRRTDAAGIVRAITIVILSLAIVTGISALLGGALAGAAFTAYFPALLIVCLACGWEAGVITLLASVMLGYTLFLRPGSHLYVPAFGEVASIVLFLLAGGLVVVVTTALRAALRKLRHAEGRYLKVVTVASSLLCETDASGRVREVQPGWSEVTGQAWPDYEGFGWQKAIHPDDHAGMRPPNTSDAIKFHQSDVRLWSQEHNDWRWHSARAVPLANASGEIEGWITALNDIHESKIARANQELIIGEHRHRLKNLVTVIDSLANWSRPRGNANIDAFLKKFLGRLHALGSVGDQVLAADWKALDAGAVIRAALDPFMDGNATRFRIGGPPLSLNEQTAGSLALAIHEMATNALKYGALSATDGVIDVKWSNAAADEGRRVSVEWIENGGPPAEKPEHEGFGMRLIRFVPAREKDGDVQMAFEPTGFRCRIAFTQTPPS